MPTKSAFGLAENSDTLFAHMNLCAFCREAQRHDADLCPEGERLSATAAEAYNQAHRQRMAELNERKSR